MGLVEKKSSPFLRSNITATAGKKWTHPLSENGPTQPEIAEVK
jgi:hypothetical protein